MNAIHNNNGKGCLASPTFDDFAYQVQMTIVKGEGGDILIRGDTKGDGYYFLVRQNGTYEFGIYKNCTNCMFTILRSASSSAINSGLNQSNLVAVRASGSTINLYVNNQLIDTVSDSSYSQGQIGVAATGVNGPTEVVFRNAKVWT